MLIYTLNYKYSNNNSRTNGYSFSNTHVQLFDCSFAISRNGKRLLTLLVSTVWLLHLWMAHVVEITTCSCFKKAQVWNLPHDSILKCEHIDSYRCLNSIHDKRILTCEFCFEQHLHTFTRLKWWSSLPDNCTFVLSQPLTTVLNNKLKDFNWSFPVWTFSWIEGVQRSLWTPASRISRHSLRHLCVYPGNEAVYSLLLPKLKGVLSILPKI